MSPDRQLLTTLGALRRQWRQRILLESLVWIVVATIVGIVASIAVLRAFTNPDADASRVLLFARLTGWALIVAAIVRGLIIPLMRRASDERFALYVEEHAPQLKQTLLTAVQEAHRPEAERVSASLSARAMTRATQSIRPLQEKATLERPRMERAGKLLGGLAVVGALLLFLGPASIRDGARLLFVPWSTAEAAVIRRLVSVEPGNATVPRGGAIEVHASLVGFAADAADLVFRADSSDEWTRLPMSRDTDSTGFRSRIFDVTKPTEYYVESADVRSPMFKLGVSDLPAVSQLSLDLRFPAYSGLPVEHIENGGDVAAIVGTTVTVNATVTRPVKGGLLHFDDGTTVPLAIKGDSTVSGSFVVKKSGFYRVDLETTDGTLVAGAVQYVVDAIPDRAPSVRIEEPGRDTKVSNTDEVIVAVRASDDLGVTKLELRYRVNGGEEKRVAIQDSTERRPRDARGAHTIFLEELNLTPGDLVAYHAVARDGAGHEGSSDVYFLEVRPFSKNYKQAEQQGGGGGGGGQQPNSPDGFVQRQRDVVAGTFNWLRDSSTTPAKKRREDITTLTISQGRLHEDVAALAKRLVDRGVAASDTTFAKIQKELESASAEMKGAEEQLGRGLGGTALPPEQRALQHLQRAEAMYRDVQVQMGGQQGGGGGGGGQQGQRPEDLADLFELQTDKLRNQYEAVQQQSSSPQSEAQREVDETLERLKQLANRQQQENERMQRMAEALRERMAQSGQGGGGSSGSQRDLAKQAEEEARRLERLSREQNNPELADAARQMQQAADAMRRAATGSAAQGSKALEELNRAARNLENNKADATNQGIQKLAQQARELESRQREIAKDVEAAQAAAGEQRTQQMQQLMDRKDAMASDVAKLEADADRLSRDGRRDQPKAASKLGEAAETIRDTRLKDKIEFSKNVMRAGSGEYAKSFEGQIGENLKDVADRMGQAAGSMQGESAARQQERALGQTRDLVQNLEALQQRMQDRQNGQNGQQGQQGQNGQRGQNGQQGQQGQNAQQGQQGQQGQNAQQGQNGQQGQNAQQGQNGQQGQRGQQGQGQQGQGQQGQGQQGQGQQGQGQQGQGQQGQGQQGQGQQGQGQQGQGQQGQQGQGQGQGGNNPQNGRGNNGNTPRPGGSPNNQFGGGFPSGVPGSGQRLSAEDSRQFAREFALRRENAEGLRRELAQQGVDTRELDRAIENLRQLENTRTFNDPNALAALQNSMIEGLKTFEFGLYRSLGLGSDGRPALGANAPVPAEYRAMIEEYYRSLAGSTKAGGGKAPSAKKP